MFPKETLIPIGGRIQQPANPKFCHYVGDREVYNGSYKVYERTEYAEGRNEAFEKVMDKINDVLFKSEGGVFTDEEIEADEQRRKVEKGWENVV